MFVSPVGVTSRSWGNKNSAASIHQPFALRHAPSVTEPTSTKPARCQTRERALFPNCRVCVFAHFAMNAYPFPFGMINILYVMGFAARPIARSERKAA